LGAIPSERDRLEVAARRLMADEAGLLHGQALLRHHLVHVALEARRRRDRAVTELEAGQLARRLAQQGEFRMAGEAAEMTTGAVELVDPREVGADAVMLDVAHRATQGRGRRRLSGVAAAEEDVRAVVEAAARARIVTALAACV